jgi:hypothetical protein
VVREESHLDDMRAAIRGDFERLAERRGTQELMRDVDAVPETELESPSEAASEDTTRPDEVDGKPRSWLARVLGL